jgi:hypothetical protein
MSYLAIFKRIIPFFLTFAAGLLIASIFVPITAPSFRNADRGGKWRHHRECKKEKESLRRENMRLRQELEQRNEIQNLKLDFELDVPPPPPPPRVVR